MMKRSDFPEDFLFGVATSSYQIEGHAQGGAGRTHWDDFAETPGNVVGAETGALACDHLNRWPEDLDLIADLGVDAYRFSTSWARILPSGTGTVNTEGLDFYDRLVDGLLERNIKPVLTLYHWELPSALADLGGWRNPQVADWFTDYARVVMDRIGDRVWSTATINEMWCVGWLSHFLGAHAPGLRDIRAAARAMHHILLSHGRAATALRADGHSNLGAVINMEWAAAASDRPEDLAAAARYDAIYNRFFMDALFKGTYPDLALQGLEPHLPQGWQDDFAEIGTPVDWCGVNYYTRSVLQDDPTGVWPQYTQIEGPLPKTAMNWEIYPKGLSDFLIRTAQDYTGQMPLYVTENGMAGHEVLGPVGVQDEARIDFIALHLAEVQRAIAAGVPVKGHMIWSLLDNYEWAYGYKERFGLVHVDFDTLKRTPKASYHALKSALDR